MAGKSFAKLVAASVASEKGELAFTDDFEYEFGKFINDRVKTRSRKASAALKPSQFKACVRMLWYYRNMPDAVSAQGPVDVDLQMQAEVGSAFHTTMQEMLVEMTTGEYRIKKFDVPRYVETLPHRGINTTVVRKNGTEWLLRNEDNFPMPISFQLDDLIEFRSRIMIWDLKTTDQRTLQAMVEPRTKDKEQLGGYTILLGLSAILITYLARDTGKRRHFLWEPTEAEKQEIIDRIHFQAAEVQKKELPDYEQHRCKTSYCPFRTQCKLDGGEPA